MILAGINKPGELINAGAKEAFVRLRMRCTTEYLSRLNALEGAIIGIRWHYLPEDVKKNLKAFFNKLNEK